MFFGRVYNKVAERAAVKMYTKLAEEKRERKPSIFKELISDPDNFILTAWTEGDEVRIRLKKKPILKDEFDELVNN